MKIDCDSCALRDLACGDCVVTLMLSLPEHNNEVDDTELAALTVMAEAGLVPGLRLLPGGRDVETPQRIARRIS